MKKQFRAAIACICTFALVGSFALAGCSSNNSSTEQKSSDTKTEQTSQTAEKVELQVFAANSLSKAMEEVQKAYIEEVTPTYLSPTRSTRLPAS